MNKDKVLSDLKKILNASLKAVAPDMALLRHMSFENGFLQIDGHKFDLTRGKTRVVGAGKGVAPMAQALESLLGENIEEGIVVTKYNHTLPLKHIRQTEAAHPVPDEAGQQGAAQILKLAAKSRPEDVLIVLLTGGASALLPAPASGLNLEDLQKTTSLLLASGANIEEINSIRKHLSSIAGGRLTEAANGAQIVTVIVSDVISDDPASIASGPTVPDNSTYADCLRIIAKYHLEDKLPASVIQTLQAGANGKLEETPEKSNKIFANNFVSLVATNKQALEAAAAEAEKLGYDARFNEQPMRGIAQAEAQNLLLKAKSIQKQLESRARPVCYLAGGETTVVIKGSGLGGRNQEMALAAIMEMDQMQNIAALFAGTDGTDGPTDAAGGFAFPDSLTNLGGIEAAKAFLDNNDSYHALQKSGDILITGPTRTNVMDLAIILVYPLD